MTNTADPRPHYRDALNWVVSLISGVQPEQLTSPTPCEEFDVRTLLGHLVATVDRARVIGEGGDPNSMPTVVTGTADDGWVAAYSTAAEAALTVWGADDRLDAIVTVPWGSIPGCAAVWAYTNETLVHGWDLAVATGQSAEADPHLAETVLAAAQSAIPESPRGGPIPFANVVTPTADAGPTERLANWSGHKSAA